MSRNTNQQEAPGYRYVGRVPGTRDLHYSVSNEAETKRFTEHWNNFKLTPAHFDNFVANFRKKQVKPYLEKADKQLQTDANRIVVQQFLQTKFSDVSIVVNGEDDSREFPAHKMILAGRSAVFAAMFQHDMTEKQENRIMIQDMLPEICEEMLRYIYTGKVTKLDENAEELLVAADKYALDILKEMCEESLCYHLKKESVVRLLILSDMHNADKLRKRCVEYCKTNAKEVVEMDDWKKLIDSRPELFGKLFQGFEFKH